MLSSEVEIDVFLSMELIRLPAQAVEFGRTSRYSAHQPPKGGTAKLALLLDRPPETPLARLACGSSGGKECASLRCAESKYLI